MGAVHEEVGTELNLGPKTEFIYNERCALILIQLGCFLAPCHTHTYIHVHIYNTRALHVTYNLFNVTLKRGGGGVQSQILKTNR